MAYPDLCIAGAGIIGLSLALELQHRGVRVTVFDQGDPLAEASTAAAGMLAVRDPENPPQLRRLSELSRALYPRFLDRIFDLTGVAVPFQTDTTLQEISAEQVEHLRELTLLTEETLSALLPQLTPAGRRFALLDEQSIDPRQLAPALLAAARAAGVDLRYRTPIRRIRTEPAGAEIQTDAETFAASQVIDCTGAWGLARSPQGQVRAIPRKGQMLAVRIPRELALHSVIRTPDLYIVPRTAGPLAGRAIIGATVEDAGFDKTVRPADIAGLRARAAELIPELAHAEEVESWAGVRPGSSDDLPMLGQVDERRFVAAGHYRNGILLAPGTALLMAQVILGEEPQVNLETFSPMRSE
jgi:glycine oxidase